MSKNIRVIPRLDIKGPNLVKGIHLEGLRVLGKPEQFARYYYETGADELVYMDVVASLYNRNSLHDIITKTANEIFIPLTVGGGLRTIEDIRDVLRVGADKVSLNTAAIKNPQIIREASRKFGSSTILVSIEAIRQADGKYLAYTDNGREYTGVEVIQWAKKVEELGAGEIMITSIDKEGTGSGYDIELTKSVSESVSIPVIASGGAGNVAHTGEVIAEGKADAVAVASILHYGLIRNHEFGIDAEKEGNREFLKSGKSFSNITPSDLQEIKKYLHDNGFECRYDRHKKILNECESNATSCHH
jgi:imidazole glycerol-phosphate synthase subunit HisF